ASRRSALQKPDDQTPRHQNSEASGNSRVTIPHRKPYVLRPFHPNIVTHSGEHSHHNKYFPRPICNLHSAFFNLQFSISLLHTLTPSPPTAYRPTAAAYRLPPTAYRPPLLPTAYCNPVSHHCRVSRPKTVCFPAFFVPNRNTHSSRSM